MNIFTFMSIILWEQYGTTAATVLIFGIFCPQGLENTKDLSMSANKPRPDATSVPNCRHKRNVPKCHL